MWKKKKTKWPLRQVGILNRNMLSSALCCCWHFCIRPSLNKHLQLMVMIGNWSCSVAWSEPQLLWRLDGLAAWVCCQTLQVCQPPHFLPGCSEQSLSSQWEAVHHSKIFSEEAVHHQSLSAGKLSTIQSFSARKLPRASQCRIRELSKQDETNLSLPEQCCLLMTDYNENRKPKHELFNWIIWEKKLTKKRKMIEQIAVYTTVRKFIHLVTLHLDLSFRISPALW